MEEIEITSASVDDAEEILALQKTAYRSEAEIYHDWTIPPLHQTLDEIRGEFSTHIILKAVCHHRIVGSVRACMRGTTCHIGKLIVDPEFQNKGLGTRLLTEIERIHPEATRFELFIGAQSLKNQHLYQKLGYREFKRESLSGQVELIFMEK